MKILANDGISKNAVEILENNGFEILAVKVAQEQVINYINSNDVSVLLVKTATKVSRELIDQCPNLKIIGCGGLTTSNVDLEYARTKGINIIKATEAYTESISELVFAHLFTCIRFLHDSNRNMPLEGDTNFNDLRKVYVNGTELRGKTLGIIGFGKVGQKVARTALGLGMKILVSDPSVNKAEIKMDFFDGQSVTLKIETKSLDEVLKESDFITLHPPKPVNHIIGKNELEMMKDRAGIINCAYGGAIDEVALVEALDNEKIAFAGLDVFESEPHPEIQILMHPNISLTPHIGALTIETRERIGEELAYQIIRLQSL